MTQVNAEKLANVRLKAEVYSTQLSDDRYVAVAYDREQNIWGVRAGTGDASISMALSDEAMEALVSCYRSHLKRNAMLRLKTEWRAIGDEE